MGQAPHRGRRVELLRDRHERGARRVEDLDDLGEIGERIRDKIAASKRKGMWMGGVPPFGYRGQDRKLVVIDSEAELLRSIFRRYTELSSVRLLKDELEVRRIGSRSWASAAGRVIGGKLFSRGALYLMLRNRTYRGEIVHKGQSHPGEHTPPQGACRPSDNEKGR